MRNKHRILNGSLQKMVLGGPKENEARRFDRKVKIASLRVVVALTNQQRVQAVTSARTKTEARNEQERARNFSGKDIGKLRASVKEHIGRFFKGLRPSARAYRLAAS